MNIQEKVDEGIEEFKKKYWGTYFYGSPVWDDDQIDSKELLSLSQKKV